MCLMHEETQIVRNRKIVFIQFKKVTKVEIPAPGRSMSKGRNKKHAQIKTPKTTTISSNETLKDTTNRQARTKKGKSVAENRNEQCNAKSR